MVLFRRMFVAGGSYFFTVTLRDRRSDFLVRHIDELRVAFRLVRQRYPFEMPAVVVLPDHLHAIWTLPAGDLNYPLRWRMIKTLFSRRLLELGVPLQTNLRGEFNLWQRRYWEHCLRDEDDFSRHIDYIHFNPVKHGHCSRVADWPYSTFAQFVANGTLPADWAGGALQQDDELARYPD